MYNWLSQRTVARRRLEVYAKFLQELIFTKKPHPDTRPPKSYDRMYSMIGSANVKRKTVKNVKRMVNYLENSDTRTHDTPHW
jgi:hypothetical protein